MNRWRSAFQASLISFFAARAFGQVANPDRPELVPDKAPAKPVPVSDDFLEKFNTGVGLFNSGLYTEAQAVLEPLLKRDDPRKAQAAYAVAQSQRFGGNFGKAFFYYEAAQQEYVKQRAKVFESVEVAAQPNDGQEPDVRQQAIQERQQEIEDSIKTSTKNQLLVANNLALLELVPPLGFEACAVKVNDQALRKAWRVPLNSLTDKPRFRHAARSRRDDTSVWLAGEEFADEDSDTGAAECHRGPLLLLVNNRSSQKLTYQWKGAKPSDVHTAELEVEPRDLKGRGAVELHTNKAKFSLSFRLKNNSVPPVADRILDAFVKNTKGEEYRVSSAGTLIPPGEYTLSADVLGYTEDFDDLPFRVLPGELHSKRVELGTPWYKQPLVWVGIGVVAALGTAALICEGTTCLDDAEQKPVDSGTLGWTIPVP